MKIKIKSREELCRLNSEMYVTFSDIMLDRLAGKEFEIEEEESRVVSSSVRNQWAQDNDPGKSIIMARVDDYWVENLAYSVVNEEIDAELISLVDAILNGGHYGPYD